jgi:hypothetical protein
LVCLLTEIYILGLIYEEADMDKNAVHYFIVCVADFAEKYKMSIKDAFLYLKKFNGIRFLIENYEIEHTLSKEDTLEAVSLIARKNGGHLSGKITEKNGRV